MSQTSKNSGMLLWDRILKVLIIVINGDGLKVSKAYLIAALKLTYWKIYSPLSLTAGTVSQKERIKLLAFAQLQRRKGNILGVS